MTHDDPVVLFESDAVRVRLMMLRPNEIGRKHYHSSVEETVLCVEGEIELNVVGEGERVLLAGQKHQVPPRRAHWLRNTQSMPAKYVLVQNGGSYDFLVDP